METWKTIEGFEGYEVSDQGNVRNKKTEHVLKPYDKDGYCKVEIRTPNNTHSKQFVHRLVANAFILNPDCLPQINHINGIKHDNRECNLEWCTNMQNAQHAWEVLGKDHRRKVILDERIEFDSVADAARYLNTNYKHVFHALNHSSTNTIKGHVIRYIEDEPIKHEPYNAMSTAKPVVIDGVYYPSLSQAAKALGMQQGNLVGALNGKNKKFMREHEAYFVNEAV